MKANTFEYPKSSFLGMPKDTAIIMKKILGNQNVLRLLYYNCIDCLDPVKHKNLTGEQIKEMLVTKQVSNIPKIWIDKEKKSYLRLTYDSFVPSEENTFYRDHIVEIKILCHFDNWDLGDFDLRPYRIAGEIDAMLDKARLTGIGILNFLGADQDIYDEEYGGLTIRYLAVRGTDDKERPLQ